MVVAEICQSGQEYTSYKAKHDISHVSFPTGRKGRKWLRRRSHRANQGIPANPVRSECNHKPLGNRASDCRCWRSFFCSVVRVRFVNYNIGQVVVKPTRTYPNRIFRLPCFPHCKMQPSVERECLAVGPAIR